MDPQHSTRLDYQCTNTSVSCPPGFTFQVHDQCFSLVKLGQDMTWGAARDHCGTLAPSADLASIRSLLEARLAAALFKKVGNKDIWIGVHDLLVEGKFENVDGSGVSADASRSWAWNHPVPAGTDVDCTKLASSSFVGSWKNVACTAKLGYALCGALPSPVAKDKFVETGPQFDPNLQLYDCNAGHVDCPGHVLAVDIASSIAPAYGGLTPAAFVLIDGQGSNATIDVPLDIAAQYAAVPEAGRTMTVMVPMALSDIKVADGFDWGHVTSFSVAFGGPAPISSHELASMGEMSISNVRLGSPLRVGHVSSPDDFHLDDMACDPVSGWFELSKFVHHSPVRFSHCGRCCCFVDNPADPAVRHCYEQGVTIAEATPGSDMAPNDQCAVCNRDVNSDVFTPRNLLLPPFVDPPYFGCNDFESCTYNDHCTDSGACVGTLYLTCLSNDVTGVPDPASNCEVCDGTGPNSPTLGCTAAPGHYV